MPRPVDRPLPHPDALASALREAGVAPPPGGSDDERQGLLFLAAHLVDHQKTLDLSAHSWTDPRFVARDERVSVDLAYVATAAATRDELRDDLLSALPRLGPRPSILGLDARRSGLKEYELEHLLFGEVVVLHRRERKVATNPRVEAAREAGWAASLKQHNLLPGRGLVVPDDQHGLLLTEPALARLDGLLVLLASSDVQMWWNPFSDAADPELQYWLHWGRGQSASAWRELLRVDGP